MMKLTITNESGETLEFDGLALTVPEASHDEFKVMLQAAVRQILKLEQGQLEAARAGKPIPRRLIDEYPWGLSTPPAGYPNPYASKKKRVS